MTLSFDATDPDGTPRLFAGMHRPPFTEVLGKMNTLDSIVTNTLRRNWSDGRYDLPLYHVDVSVEKLASTVVSRLLDMFKA